MSKMPAFQFYPADWRKDPGVQSLSWADRGVWIEILCLMHESPRRGVLLMPSGAPMTSVSLSRIIGLPMKQTVDCLERLVESGVASREMDSGALLNRRMVRDESIRYVRSEAGKLGGNPDLLKQKSSKTEEEVNHTSNQKPTPSPSPSTSPSTSVGEKKESLSEIPKKSKRAPRDFTVSEKNQQWAYDRGFSYKLITEETAAFMDWEFKTARSDWPAAWRNWLRNTEKTQGNGNGKQNIETRGELLIRRQKEELDRALGGPTGDGFGPDDPGGTGALVRARTVGSDG